MNKIRKKRDIKKFKTLSVTTLMIISLLSTLVLSAVPVSACYYTVGTFENDYTTPKTDFFQGEIVYGKGTRDIPADLKLRIRDPSDTVVGESDVVYGTEVTGSWLLEDDAPTGLWSIQVGVYDNNKDSWRWREITGRTAYFTVHEIPPNNPPVANDDYYTVQENEILDVTAPGVLFNDTDDDNDSLTASLESDPSFGSLTYNEDGSFVYTPDEDFSGNDSFTYKAFDGTDFSNEATVHIKVTQEEQPPTVTLTINIEGDGIVLKNPDQVIFVVGSVVKLTAVPDPGWIFSSWSGDISTAENPVNVTMDSDKNITATFVEIPPEEYTLTIIIIGNGSVDIDPEEDTYEEGAIVQLTAFADTDWVFDSWGGDISSTENPVNVTMDSDKTITAVFGQPLPHEFTLTIHIDGSGIVVINPELETYTYGTIVGLTANPDTGWTFDYWSGDLAGSNNPDNITMTSDKNITAHFKQEENKDEPSPNRGGGGTPDKPPVADAGGPYQGFVDEEIILDGSSSHDPDGRIVSWIWTFEDDTTESGEIIKHTFSDTGTFTVVLTVKDSQGYMDNNETTILIIQPNRPPTTPEIIGPSEGEEEKEYTFTAKSTDDDNDELQYIFDWGDGSKDTSATIDSGLPYSNRHIWETEGTYTITVTATDGQSSSSAEIEVIIEPAPEHIPETGNWALIILAILALLLFIIFTLLIQRDKHKQKQK